jgi:hypothetical protein
MSSSSENKLQDMWQKVIDEVVDHCHRHDDMELPDALQESLLSSDALREMVFEGKNYDPRAFIVNHDFPDREEVVYDVDILTVAGVFSPVRMEHFEEGSELSDSEFQSFLRWWIGNIKTPPSAYSTYWNGMISGSLSSAEKTKGQFEFSNFAYIHEIWSLYFLKNLVHSDGRECFLLASDSGTEAPYVDMEEMFVGVFKDESAALGVIKSHGLLHREVEDLDVEQLLDRINSLSDQISEEDFADVEEAAKC